MSSVAIRPSPSDVGLSARSSRSRSRKSSASSSRVCVRVRVCVATTGVSSFDGHHRGCDGLVDVVDVWSASGSFCRPKCKPPHLARSAGGAVATGALRTAILAATLALHERCALSDRDRCRGPRDGPPMFGHRIQILPKNKQRARCLQNIAGTEEPDGSPTQYSPGSRERNCIARRNDAGRITRELADQRLSGRPNMSWMSARSSDRAKM